MNLADLMHGLTQAGFTIHRDGGCKDLEVRGPVAKLTPLQKEGLREHKQTLLQLLPADPSPVETFPAEHLQALREATVHVEPYIEDERWAIQNEHLFEPPADDWDDLPGLPPLPTVVNVKDCPEDWRDNPRYRYIGRVSQRLGLPQSMYHNPFPVGKPETPEKRLACIEKYRGRLLGSTMLKAMAKAELPGKILVCYCKPKPCHGDMLREFIAEACWDPRYVEWWQSNASTATLSESPSGSHPPGDSNHNRPL